MFNYFEGVIVANIQFCRGLVSNQKISLNFAHVLKLPNLRLRIAVMER